MFGMMQQVRWRSTFIAALELIDCILGGRKKSVELGLDFFLHR